MIEDVILTTDNCRYCLMCRHVAPVERVTHRETLSPHGWGLLIASERRGLIEWNEDTVDALYSAADNGNSRANCVTDQPLPEAIAAARAQVAERGLAPPVAYQIDEALRTYGTPYREEAPRAVEGQSANVLYAGDDAPYLWPEALSAALELAAALGIEPVQAGYGRSSGYLASSLGFPETARQLAHANLDDIRRAGGARVIVLSPGDYFTFGQLWAERLGIEWPEDLALVELVTLLDAALAEGRLHFNRAGDDRPYAYVDPTLAVRVAARHDIPRRLVDAVMPGERVELLWRCNRAHPAGSNALQFTKPDIAEALTRSRLADAKSHGAEVVITEDAGTLHHLSRYAGEYGVEVVGLYELLARQLAR